ncbi:hypothetical protein AB0O39_39200 [Streptomyces anulatus]|uniref:hypothetical protein n=1 Tax=Streptomyces anulatus TaxID=1892 RepID=UPI003418EA52
MRAALRTASVTVTALLAAGLAFAQPAQAAGGSDLYATINATALANTVSYEVLFNNAGPNNTTGPATATLVLPPQTTSASVDFAFCDYDNTTKTVTCDLPTVLVNHGIRPTVTAQFGLLTLGPFTATASITGTDPDPQPGNNTTSATCTAVTGLIIVC